MKPSRFSVLLRRSFALAALTAISSSQALAATWYWDVNSSTTGAQQGPGNWNNSDPRWWNGSSTVAWDNFAGHIAHFGSTSGEGLPSDSDAQRTIKLGGTLNASGLIFNATTLATFILTEGEIVLPNGATIDVRGSNGTDAANRRHRIHSTIAGSDIKITRSTTSALALIRLYGSNYWTGTLSLSALSGEGIFVEAMNGPSINSLNSVSIGANSSMILASSQTYTPSFSIAGSGAGGNRGAIRFDVNGGTVTGPITLTGNATINALGGVTGTVSGTIDQVTTGRTLTLNPNGGTLVFTADNNFIAPVNISSGNLILNGSNSISSTITVGANSIALLGQNEFKGAGKVTLNGGSLTLGSLNAVKASGSIANPIELTGSENTITAVVGPGGFTEEEFANLPSYPTSGSGTASYGMSALADIYWTGALSGTRSFAKGGLGTLTLLGTRTDSGGVNIREGSLRFFHIADGGQPSSIGTSSSAAASVLLSGGRLAYEGPQAQTNRLFTLSASSVIDASGSGPLRFTNTGSIANIGTSARTLVLTGYAPGENRIDSVISNAGTGAVSLTKRGSNSWTLAGSNTYTGTTRIDGGKLVVDYSEGKDPISGAGSVTHNAGDVVFRGTTGGVTKTLNAFQLSVNHHAAANLKFENRVNLTVSTLSGSGNVQRNDLIDISSNPNNSLTVSSLNANNHLRIVNGVMLGNASTELNGRASIVFRDKDGTYGFPALSGGTSGDMVKMTPDVNFTGGGTALLNSLTTDYRFTKGTYTTDGIPDAAGNWKHLHFHTITLDSTAATFSEANKIKLQLNSARFSPNGSGRGILITGNNDVTISNSDGANSNTQPIWIHNYLDEVATFNVQADFDQQYLIFGGTGFTDHFGFLQQTDNFYLLGSTVRISKPQTIDDIQGNFRVSTGGVLEIGADFFKSTFYAGWGETDFIKPVRATPAGGITFYGDSGLGAYVSAPTATSKRVVDFAESDMFTGRPISQNLVWGAERFLTQPDTDNDGDYTFKLSSTRSNALLQIRNNINLNGRNRNIEVADGTAPVDALLSGVLSGSDASGIIKSGPGTLQLSGQNTFKGETRIQAGKLIVGTGNLHEDSMITLITSGQGGSGQLEVTSDLSVASVTINGVPQLPGKVTHAGIIEGGGSLYVGGTLTPYQEWANSSGLLSGESAGDIDADFDGVKNGIEYAVGTNPKASTPSVLSQVAGSPASVRFTRATSPARTDLNLYLESSADLSGSWTVLATSTGGAAMVSSVGISATVSEASGTVTVTDNRTHTTGKVFYRLRAEIP
jgi:autotransporter-associated beta strand protein